MKKNSIIVFSICTILIDICFKIFLHFKISSTIEFYSKNMKPTYEQLSREYKIFNINIINEKNDKIPIINYEFKTGEAYYSLYDVTKKTVININKTINPQKYKYVPSLKGFQKIIHKDVKI